jgi:hypothetical protein
MAAGPASLPLLFLCLLAAPEDNPPAAGSLSPPGSLTRRFEWSFDTTDPEGRELYAMREVGLFMGGRPTHPQWLQEFGARADPKARDRFPREPEATLWLKDVSKTHRVLHLQSRGDHLLVHLARPVAAAGGVALRLGAQVRLQGQREGALKLRVRFSGEGLAAPARLLESPPLSEAPDWRKVELAGRVPERAESLDLEILLEGSYKDGPAQAWVDSVVLELSPGLTIDWPGRSLLLFAGEETAIPFHLESRGLPPGTYLIAAEMERLYPEGGAAARGPLSFAGRRYVAKAAAGAMTGLRFRGDVRQMFAGPLPPGLWELRIKVRGPTGPSVDDGAPVAEGSERLGLLPAAPGPPRPAGLRLGWAVSPAEILQGDLGLLAAIPATFPLAELLWDLGDLPQSAPPHELVVPAKLAPAVKLRPAAAPLPELPPSVKLRGAAAQTPWVGRAGRGFLAHPDAAALLRGWAPAIRFWALPAEAAELSKGETLKRLLEPPEAVNLGATGGGARPSWASFREFEAAAGGSMQPPLEDLSPHPRDWALLSASRSPSERDDFLRLSGLLLDFARAGHRRLFLKGPAAFLAERTASGHAGPRLPLLAWAVLGRLLSGDPIQDRQRLDPRGRFVAVRDGEEQLLIAMSRGDGFRVRVWTGRPISGEDLFGEKMEVPFDSATLESDLSVEPRPVVYRGLDLGIADTLDSLSEVEPGLRPIFTAQDLSFRLTNRAAGPVTLGLGLVLPPGHLVEGRPQRTILPGEEAILTFQVTVPDSLPSGRIRATLAMDLEAGGKKIRFSRERFLEIRSRNLRITPGADDPAGRTLFFNLECVSGRPIAARVDCRVLLGGSRDLLWSWDERLLPGGRRTLSMPLEPPLDPLVGKEVRITAEVRGSPDSLSERYFLRKVAGKLALRPD